jgi:hypothetical protein
VKVNSSARSSTGLGAFTHGELWCFLLSFAGTLRYKGVTKVPTRPALYLASLKKQVEGQQ